MPTEKTGVPAPWLRNSAGRADAMLSIAVLFALAGLATFLLGGSELVVGGLHLRVPSLDGAGVSALLTVVSAYVVRRNGIGARKGDAPASPAP